MALIIKIDTTKTPSPVMTHFDGEYLNYNGQTGYLAFSDADLSAYNAAVKLVNSVPDLYLMADSGTLREMTLTEKNAVDGAIQSALLSTTRSDAKAAIVGLAAEPMVLRSIASIVVDELNILREWIVSFKVAIAAATSLANLQARVALLPDLPDRTLAQVKTAIQTKIDTGTVDG